MGKVIGIIVIGIIALIVLYFLFTLGPKLLFTGFSGFETKSTETTEKGINDKGALAEQSLLKFGLRTNTSQAAIPLENILDGGPGKDGIPAIDTPTFRSIDNALETELPNGFGVAISMNNVSRWYPYNIMVWHEIVNDSFNGVPALVTFCPLCGSAIVFDPVVQGTKRDFGVSGLLWESNLLMYDKMNESLWSQAKGEAVVGVDTGTKLAIYDSEVMTLSQFANQFPDGEVLARPVDTQRNYDFYPYGDYDRTDTLVFPISITDTRLPAKTLMYVVASNGTSIAFKRDDLFMAENVQIEVNGNQLQATATNGTISVKDANGNELPGYTSMWFSWATHHQDDGVVWVN